MASAKCKPIEWVWGAEPPVGPGEDDEGIRGKPPQKLKAFSPLMPHQFAPSPYFAQFSKSKVVKMERIRECLALSLITFTWFINTTWVKISGALLPKPLTCEACDVYDPKLLYNNMTFCTLAPDEWSFTFGTVKRSLDG